MVDVDTAFFLYHFTQLVISAALAILVVYLIQIYKKDEMLPILRKVYYPQFILLQFSIMGWLLFFVRGMYGMAVVFERVAQEVERHATGQEDDATLKLLRPLDHRARRVLGLFAQQELIVSSNVANLFGISVRQARDLLAGWVAQGWLDVADPSRRGRKYRLADRYHELLE